MLLGSSDKGLDNYFHALRFGPDSYTVQKMCNKAVRIYPFLIQIIPKCYETPEMCDKVVFQTTFYTKILPS